MIPYSSLMSPLARTSCLICLEKRAVVSKPDGCKVVLVKCEECNRGFCEELDAAKRVVSTGGVFLCLSCDGDADEPAITGFRLSDRDMLVFNRLGE